MPPRPPKILPIPEPEKGLIDLTQVPEQAPVRRLRIEGGEIGSLPSVAAGKNKLPSKEDIVQLAVDVYRMALDNVSSYRTKRGETVREKRPDFRGACEALRVIAAVSGHTGRTFKGAEEQERESAAKAEQERLRLVEQRERTAEEAAAEEASAREEEERSRKVREELELDAAAALRKMRSRTALEEEEKSPARDEDAVPDDTFEPEEEDND